MQIIVSGDNIDVTEALKNTITEKLEKISHHFDHITKIHVTLSVEKKIRQRAEAVINSAGQQIFASAIDEDLYKAIDQMIAKADKQILKHKEKLKDHRK